jgi:hypothetical protein
MPKLTRIEIIWDNDHGLENEGWYLRKHFRSDFTDYEEDQPIDAEPTATDEELIYLYGAGCSDVKVLR